jgi:predicted O-methyltransferase YrrM
MQIDVNDALFQAHLALKNGQTESARALLDAAQKGGSIPAWGLAVQIEFFSAVGAGHMPHEIVSRVEDDPNAQCLSSVLAAADYLAQIGVNRRAAALYQMVLDWKFDYPGAYQKFSACRFPDAHYLYALEEIHRFKQPKVYLEIGVNKGRSFHLAGSSALSIGIDPDLSSLQRRVLDNAKLFETTSDHFFEHEAKTMLRDTKIDLAFIDGMHDFEFVIRDFINLERWMSPNSMIAIHDVIPVHRAGAGKNSTAKQWTGDVWKITDVLHRYRPDLDLRIINAGPTGMLLVSRLDPDNQVLTDHANDVQSFAENLSYGEGLVWRPTYKIPECGIMLALAEISARERTL